MRMDMGICVIAIDWSGDRRTAHRKTWLAEVVQDRLVRLEAGRHRELVAEHLIELARRDPRMVVGLDFAFSLPRWFLDSRDLSSAAELWALAEREAEAWLATCTSPFWGRPQKMRSLDVPDEYRRTELDVGSTAGIRPKSVFQIGGAGAVGTGSLRGMSTLRRLRAAGFSIWPFDPPVWPRVIEIYPRVLTGAVNKSSQSGRLGYLSDKYPDLDDDLLEQAARSEDAFDAAVSALVMATYLDELVNLLPASDRHAALEGLIWYPGLCHRELT
ncbi:MAG: DUF429 domain-containing protein [Chloroflexota bacterium]|nr:DUF429 domain-containing protein [Chloroflexota bacterium]